jgi:hypothetical protein
MKANPLSIPVSLRILLEDGKGQDRRTQPQSEPRPEPRPEPRLDRVFRVFVRVAYASEPFFKLAVMLGALYLLIRIGPAFLPGGAVDRVLGGLR